MKKEIPTTSDCIKCFQIIGEAVSKALENHPIWLVRRAVKWHEDFLEKCEDQQDL